MCVVVMNNGYFTKYEDNKLSLYNVTYVVLTHL